MTMDCIPFSSDAFGGWGETHGLLRFEGGTLSLQFETRDALFGVMRSAPKTVEIPFDKLAGIRFSHGWFWMFPHIEIRVSDIQAFADLPIVDKGTLTLGVAWRDRRNARELAQMLDSLRAEFRYRRLQADIERMTAPAGVAPSSVADGPPPAPPQSPARLRAVPGQVADG